MQPIGGYFSLELPYGEEYHKNAIRLNTGRNCLEYILRARGYKKAYIPYYTCDVVLEPFKKLGICYEYYHVNLDLEISEDLQLKNDEALLYTNYFGLKQSYVKQLSAKYGKQLIIDNTQAFFAKPVVGIDTFYTCRKFFGVPDGAYLYIDKKLDEELEQDVSWDRMNFLNKRIDLGAEAGYGDFKGLSHSLSNQPIKRMSKLTQRMMQSIDYDTIAQRRRSNYLILQNSLVKGNDLKLPLEDDAVPMVYPYFTQDEGLREKLIGNKVFVARYWPNVLEWTNKDDIEYKLAFQTQHLPIDQRYDEEEMKYILDLFAGFPYNSINLD